MDTKHNNTMGDIKVLQVLSCHFTRPEKRCALPFPLFAQKISGNNTLSDVGKPWETQSRKACDK
jgi:hypothetical protein